MGLKGQLHGGQQPVEGALIQLMAAGTSGYGGSAVPLLSSAVYTNASGGFSITGQYTCPSASTPVYLLATGGNPGLPSGQTNPDLALMAGLGACGNLTDSTFISVNEVTTVATAYALAGYMTSATNLSSSGTALAQQGLANAFGTIDRMVDVSTGFARTRTPAGNATVPAAEINTLANILSACVNSAGSAASGSLSPCIPMEAAAVDSGGTSPANTVEVALNMAHLPGQAVTTLYNLQPPTPPFQPTLAAGPQDWTVSLVYGTKLPAPTTTAGLAIDGNGNVWTAGSTSNIVRVIGSDGTELSGPSGYAVPGVTNPTSVAVDLNGNGWVGGGNGTIAGVSQAGVAQSGAGYSTGHPVVNGLAVSVDNTLWMTNQSYVTHLTNAGTAVAPTPAQAYSNAFGAAVDSAGDLWLTNNYYQTVSKLAVGAPFPVSYQIGILTPRGVAIGRDGHVWVAIADDQTHGVAELNSTGAAVSGSPYSGPSLMIPFAVAVDGDNHAWIGAANCHCISALASGGTPVTPSDGVAKAAVDGGMAVGIDGSGNVWNVNFQGSVAELVGAGAPTVTPLAYAAKNNLLGQRP